MTPMTPMTNETTTTTTKALAVTEDNAIVLAAEERVGAILPKADRKSVV